jgi:hypothetical protein
MAVLIGQTGGQILSAIRSPDPEVVQWKMGVTADHQPVDQQPGCQPIRAAVRIRVAVHHKVVVQVITKLVIGNSIIGRGLRKRDPLPKCVKRMRRSSSWNVVNSGYEKKRHVSKCETMFWPGKGRPLI